MQRNLGILKNGTKCENYSREKNITNNKFIFTFSFLKYISIILLFKIPARLKFTVYLKVAFQIFFPVEHIKNEH